MIAELEILMTFVDEPVIPVKLGFCINPVSRYIGTTEPCSSLVFDTDSDAIEVPGGILCGKCVNTLLAAKPVIDLVDKVKTRQHRKHTGGNGGRPGPRFPRYFE